MESTSSSSSRSHSPDQELYPTLNDDFSIPGIVKQPMTILVTGFGPFDGHDINASWEAVKALQALGSPHNSKLVAKEIPVVYDHVSQCIPDMWKSHAPKIVVHVGVSGYADEITIETCAHNSGYNRLDVTGCTARSLCYKDGGTECLSTGLNVQRICEDVNESGCLAMATLSSNAGRYLCEYIYYASLCEDRSRVIFVHVPPLDSPYTAKELGHALQVIIISMMKQLGLYHPLPLTNDELDSLQQQK